MEHEFCPNCKEHSAATNAFYRDNFDDRHCDYCDSELVDAVEFFAENFYWKGREVMDFQIENDRIAGLWLACGPHTQYIRVNISTLQSAVEDGLKGFETVTERYVGSRFHFRSLLEGSAVVKIKFAKKDWSVREMYCELLNSENYTRSEDSKPRKISADTKKFVQPVYDLQKLAVRSFDLRNLISLNVDGIEYKGQFTL